MHDQVGSVGARLGNGPAEFLTGGQGKLTQEHGRKWPGRPRYARATFPSDGQGSSAGHDELVVGGRRGPCRAGCPKHLVANRRAERERVKPYLAFNATTAFT